MSEMSPQPPMMPAVPAGMLLRVECPPGACVCERGRVLADPQADQRPLLITRQQEQKLIERIGRVDSLPDLRHVQQLIRKNVGTELRIAPGPNEVRTVRGILVVLEERPGLCKKLRQSVPAAVRRCLQERPHIAWAILDEGGLFGPT